MVKVGIICRLKQSVVSDVVHDEREGRFVRIRPYPTLAFEIGTKLLLQLHTVTQSRAKRDVHSIKRRSDPRCPRLEHLDIEKLGRPTIKLDVFLAVIIEPETDRGTADRCTFPRDQVALARVRPHQ